MSSKSGRAGGKEKWVSGNEFKFETPQKMPRKARQGRHLSIPSPWMHKANSQVKPGQAFPVKKTPIKKSSSHVMKKRSQNKRVRIFLDEEYKPKKTPKIKQAVISLTAVNAEDKNAIIKGKDWDDEMEYDEAELGNKTHSDTFDSQKPKRRSASKLSIEKVTNGSSPKNKKIMQLAEKSSDARNGKFDLSELMSNGDQDELPFSNSTNPPLEELTELEDVITGELAKADLNEDPTKTSAIPEGKPVKSWCSIA